MKKIRLRDVRKEVKELLTDDQTAVIQGRHVTEGTAVITEKIAKTEKIVRIEKAVITEADRDFSVEIVHRTDVRSDLAQIVTEETDVTAATEETDVTEETEIRDVSREKDQTDAAATEEIIPAFRHLRSKVRSHREARVKGRTNIRKKTIVMEMTRTA